MPNKGKNCLHSTPGSDTEQLKLVRSFTSRDDTDQQPGKKTTSLEACRPQVKVAAEPLMLNKTKIRRGEIKPPGGKKAQIAYLAAEICCPGVQDRWVTAQLSSALLTVQTSLYINILLTVHQTRPEILARVCSELPGPSKPASALHFSLPFLA